MSEAAERDTIGQRIADARKARGLTQLQLAQHVPCSKSLIAQVERGHKPASPALTAGVARALDVGLGRLTGQPYIGESARSDRLHATIPDIRRAVLSWDLPDEELPARATGSIAVDVARASALGRGARYVQLGEMLPALLDELCTATHAATESERAQLFGLLAEAYTGATAITYALGYFDLRSLAMERVQWASEESGDPLRIARTQWQRSTLFLQASAYAPGRKLLDRIRRDVGDDDVARMDAATLSVHGAVHLRSAIFAARETNRVAAWDHIAAARETAQLLGGDANHYGLEFGPSNVAIHALGVAVELCDGAEAARLAESTRLPASVAPVRAGHFYIDAARGWMYHGRRDKAFEALQRARRTAPQQTRNHPQVRETVHMLVRQERRRRETLSGFAAWLGMT